MSVEWGPVSSWVGSLLTGGSLLLGFNIMRRDRARDEAADARLLSCKVRGEKHQLVVRVTNAGTQPIHHLTTAMASQSQIDAAGGRIPASITSWPDHGLDIAPGAKDEIVLSVSRTDDDRLVPFYVSFTDPSGRRWRRWLDGTLERNRTYDPLPWERVTRRWERFHTRTRLRSNWYGRWWEQRKIKRQMKNEPH